MLPFIPHSRICRTHPARKCDEEEEEEEEEPGSDEALRFFHLKGKYYQWLGDAWDHDSKDFKPCYRPLYSCDAKADRFEAHVRRAELREVGADVRAVHLR